jgi:hypothetical protein
MQFGGQVGGERIVGGEFGSDGARGRRRQAFGLVQGRQLG